MTDEALLALATLIDAQQSGARTRVRNLAAAYGLSPDRARRAVAVLEKLELVERHGHLLVRTTTPLQAVLVAGRAADRWADREDARRLERRGTSEQEPAQAQEQELVAA